MKSLLAALLAFVAVVEPRPEGIVRDSFIRDNVKIEYFPRLTDNARQGKTHLDSSGSGFFITEDGYLLTNHHVVDGAAELVVVKDGKAYLADLKAQNKEHDLALLKINAFPRPHDGLLNIRGLPRFTPLKRSDEMACRVGQTILVVGFPKIDLQGLEPKVTRGIVSSLTGYKGADDRFQMDAAIQNGNSGGPVVDEWGRLVGVSVSGLVGGENVNYAVCLREIVKFLPKGVGFEPSVVKRRRDSADVAAGVIKSVALILNYAKGADGSRLVLPADDTARRESNARRQKAVIAARRYKLRRDWASLKDVTDGILSAYGEVEDVREMNELAREKLGLHLVIVAEADGRDVTARITPVCGFKEKYVDCGRPTAVFGGAGERYFPIEAKLTYEDEDWLWAATFKCVYDWHGTKEVRVELKHVGKK